MGRASRLKGAGNSGSDFRVGAGEQCSSSELFPLPNSPENLSEVGALIDLPDGTRMEIQEGDPASLLRGLAEVESVENLSDGTSEVRFRNGDTARLSFHDGTIAFASGEASPMLASAAFAATLAHDTELLGVSQSEVPETQVMLQNLADIQSQLQADPNDPELLRQQALALQELSRAGLQSSQMGENDEILEKPLMPDTITLDDPNMSRRIVGEPIEPAGDIDQLAARQESFELVQGAIEAARQGAGAGMSTEQLLMAGAGLDPENPDALHLLPTPEEITENRRAALVLSGLIDPETGEPRPGVSQEDIDSALDPFQLPGIASGGGEGSIPDVTFDDGRIEFTPIMNEHMTTVRNAMAGGERFFIFRGPPGTGKDTVAEMVASSQQMPLVKIQLGGSNDVNNQKGGFAVVTVEKQEIVYDEVQQEDGTYTRLPRMERIPDPDQPDGWAREEDGSYKTKPITKTVRTQETKTIEGAIAEAGKYPSVIVIQEPEGQEHDMVQLHGFFGDRTGSAEGRSVMIDSPDGKTVSIHPRCVAIITTNEVPSDQSRDGRFQASTYDRAEPLDFPPIPPEESAERMAAGVNTMVRENRMMQAFPYMQREHTASDLLVFAQMQQELEAAGLDVPSRAMPEVYRVFVQTIADPTNTKEPVKEAHRRLRYLYPMKMPDEQKMDELGAILDDFNKPLRKIEEAIKREISGESVEPAEEKEPVDA